MASGPSAGVTAVRATAVSGSAGVFSTTASKAARAAAAALFQLRAADARAAYEAVVETTPALPLTAVARTTSSTPVDGREATLRYVITH